jgi:DHA1 family multidrug resistance protein-like MFS transporter
LPAVFATRLFVRTGTRFISPVLPLFIAAMLPESSRVATMAGIAAGAGAAASSVGAVVMGRAGDRIGYRRVLLASTFAAAVFYALQAAVTNMTQLILLQICVGAAISGTISSLAAMLATLAPEGQQGVVYGVDTSVVSGANALGPVIGAALAVAMGIRATFLLAAGTLALAAMTAGYLLPEQPKPDTPLEPASVGASH